MCLRAPLPLRLVQSSWPSAAPRQGHSSTTRQGTARRLVAAYKPCGLPYFSQSQETEAHDGRQLFGLGNTLSAQPKAEDVSDSLCARVVDVLTPGATPYIALPLVAAPLLDGSGESASGSISPRHVNQWTAAYKGLTLVAFNRADCFFLRNASRMGLVNQTYRVVCKLPSRSVARSARLAIEQRHEASQRARSTFLNPYLQDFIAANSPTRDSSNGRSTTSGGRGMSSRNCLLQGSFFDSTTGFLLYEGSISGYVNAHMKLSDSSEKALRDKQRLHSLFTKRQTAASEDTPLTSTHSFEHPWRAPSSVLTVTHPNVRGGKKTSSGSRRTPSGRWAHFSYRLVAISPLHSNDYALYEVTGCGLNPEEISALFAAEGLMALNDYVHDGQLAQAMESVAAAMRNAPAGKYGHMSVGLQHQLRSATAEELVAMPLFRHPLEAADRHSLKLFSDVLTASGTADANSEFTERVLRHVTSAARRDPTQHLLLDCLLSAPPQTYRHVVGLAMGSGVECVSVSYPDPSHDATVLAVQQALMRFEEGAYTEEHREDMRARMQWVSHSSHAEGGTTVPLRSVWPSSSAASSSKHRKSLDTMDESCLTYAVAINQALDDDVDSAQEAGKSLNDILHVAAVPSSLMPGSITTGSALPSQDSLSTVVRSKSAQDSNGESPALFFRAEEASDIMCSHCGAVGCSWHICPEYHAMASALHDRVAGTPAVALTAAGAALPSGQSNSEEAAAASTEIIDSVSALSGILQQQEHSRAREASLVINTPNMAPTAPLNVHSIQREQSKPAMHRRALRCAYCHGRHHITECPKLNSSNPTMSAAGQDGEVDADKIRESSHELFCICCGAYGHLHTECPRVPDGLHRATHCPICRVALHKVRHDAVQCPRRVSAPAGYLPSGVPQKFVRDDRQSRGGARHNPRRRKGSMLMADSFVDSGRK